MFDYGRERDYLKLSLYFKRMFLDFSSTLSASRNEKKRLQVKVLNCRDLAQLIRDILPNVSVCPTLDKFVKLSDFTTNLDNVGRTSATK